MKIRLNNTEKKKETLEELGNKMVINSRLTNLYMKIPVDVSKNNIKMSRDEIKELSTKLKNEIEKNIEK